MDVSYTHKPIRNIEFIYLLFFVCVKKSIEESFEIRKPQIQIFALSSTVKFTEETLMNIFLTFQSLL